ncbi:hypothetical protein J1N35_018626 [Gossypium stocksii]|uniref:Uncharacterized protein n=2 Tax=Gossypium stocksii TaxID=47602 RepID=A0A9D3VPC9_9ROSI|nr:hypothetical protein J1N35_018623 [Gossypium stocksii]KAH1091369.1 hypothetical protein J1N35_018626 [Gossypium stocksii]
MDFFYYFHIEISSFIGIAEYERFFQPYQIWTIQTMFGGINLSSVDEDKDHLSKTIDMCYNNFSNYQVQAGIDLMLKPQYLLQHNTYVLWTDGRRILAYNTERPHQNRDEDSLQLLKKIAEMEIDDYPLTMEIKDTWESWNSPPVSPDSLHLDEIEEMNLTNIQEG